jgi:hypothetical protein
MEKKPINAYIHLRLSYVINTVCLLYVSAALVAILREVSYKGYIAKTSRTNAYVRIISFKMYVLKYTLKLKYS